MPAVVFFRRTRNGFTDISVATLDSADLMHGFQELYEVIEDFKKKDFEKAGKYRYIRWIPGAIKFVGIEAFRAALGGFIKAMIS